MYNREHPWKSSFEKYQNELIPTLQNYAVKVMEFAKKKNKRAEEIIKYYEALKLQYDPMSHMILEQELSSLIKENNL